MYHDEEQTIVAHGVANVATGAPMLEDTGFLFGSITKVMTATLVLQQVERGVIDIDEPIVRYLPEFQLAAPSSTEQIGWDASAGTQRNHARASRLLPWGS